MGSIDRIGEVQTAGDQLNWPGIVIGFNLDDRWIERITQDREPQFCQVKSELMSLARGRDEPVAGYCAANLDHLHQGLGIGFTRHHPGLQAAAWLFNAIDDEAGELQGRIVRCQSLVDLGHLASLEQPGIDGPKLASRCEHQDPGGQPIKSVQRRDVRKIEGLPQPHQSGLTHMDPARRSGQKVRLIDHHEPFIGREHCELERHRDFVGQLAMKPHKGIGSVGVLGLKGPPLLIDKLASGEHLGHRGVSGEALAQELPHRGPAPGSVGEIVWGSYPRGIEPMATRQRRARRHQDAALGGGVTGSSVELSDILCNNDPMRAILAVLVAAFCFSTTGTSRALAEVDASSLGVGAARILIGGGLLGLIALVRHHRHPAPPAVRTGPLPDAALIAIGALGVLAYQPTFFLGTQLNGVAIGTVIALGSAPLCVGLLDGMLHRRLPSRRWFAATGMAIVGVALVSGVAGGQLGSLTPLGITASLGAGASYAIYTLASKELLAHRWDPTDAMGTVFGTAAVLSVPVLLLSDTSWLVTPSGAALALWLGVVTTTVAYLAFGWGLARLNATTVATLTLAEPLSATVLGIFVLGEQLTPASILGIITIAAGLTLLTLPGRKEPVDVPTPA